ncbi:MAG: NAD-dependent epimerase/dehydratase family protein [Elusimicrobia bacterium]|nr:NAD-dependent epimerase/dehydratase family protein [Elusimicrobiota bacterium]
MSTILVTGSEGFIGKNLIVALEQSGYHDILKYDIDNNEGNLENYLKQAEIIFHLAGVNRPKSENEFKKGNEDLTQTIVNILGKNKKRTPMVFTSSIQAKLKNPYGISKKNAENVLFNYAKKTKAKVFVYRLPNVFGKWCKPNYNSAVATFCHNIARNIDINITDEKKEIELVYIDDVVSEFIKLLNKKEKYQKKYYFIKKTFKISLGELAKKIYQLNDILKTLIMPNLSYDLTRDLYETYLSYLDKNDFSYKLDQKADRRGSLVEILKSHQSGQIFVSKSKRGVIRGNHYHNTKIEKFWVIEGKAEIKFRHILNNEILSYLVSGEDIKVVDIPPGYIHSIENKGEDELIVVFWASSIFNSENPDTYALEVL